MPSEYCDPAATHLDLTRGTHLDPYSTSTHLDLDLDLRLEAARSEVRTSLGCLAIDESSLECLAITPNPQVVNLTLTLLTLTPTPQP